MSNEMNHYKNEVERLITENFEEVEMDATYRLGMRQQTSHIISSRSRKSFACRILALPAAIAVAVVAIHLLNTVRIIHPSVNKINEPTNSIVKNQPPVAGPGSKPTSSSTGTSNKQMTKLPGVPTGLVGISSEPLKIAAGELLVVITALQSPVTDGNGKSLSAGSRLRSGAIVRTGKGGRVTLVTRKGAELCLDSNSESSVKAGGIAVLRKGRLYVSNRVKEIAQIETSAGKIKLLGTVVDTAVVKKDAVAVTVVEGKVQLVNSRGRITVDAGKRSVMTASLAPESGKEVNTVVETAWYEGRRDIVSDFGDIAYTVPVGDAPAFGVWVMNFDGSNKRRIKSYLGWIRGAGPWLPGQQRFQVDSWSVDWTTPDLKERRGYSNAGHPIIDQRSWLLNAATSQDMPFEMPKGYQPIYTSISPDSTKMAFCGWYLCDSDIYKKDSECGVWVYFIDTGEMRKVLDGQIKTPVTWAPDSRMLAVSTGEDYGTDHPLVLVDSMTGQVTRLNVQGAGASFSPDGTKLAYCGEFKEGGSWRHGVPTSGSIWVKDLISEAEPVRISPSGEGALNPHWSPDGTRVVYDLLHWESLETGNRESSFIMNWQGRGNSRFSFKVVVAQADGSGCLKVCEAESDLDNVSWDESGKALYISTKDALLIVDPDGSGVKAEISYKDGNVLSPEEKAQTEAALADIREAIFQYALGKVKNYEGDVAGTIACFRKSSDLFTELVWKYPLSGFGVDDTTAYADKAAELAARPAASILSTSCKERTTYLSILLGNFMEQNKRMPGSISEIREFALSKDGWKFNWLSGSDKEHVKMLFGCPADSKRYAYKVPAASGVPLKAGEAVFTCPNHPGSRIYWDEGKQQTWDSAMKR